MFFFVKNVLKTLFLKISRYFIFILKICTLCTMNPTNSLSCCTACKMNPTFSLSCCTACKMNPEFSLSCCTACLRWTQNILYHVVRHARWTQNFLYHVFLLARRNINISKIQYSVFSQIWVSVFQSKILSLCLSLYFSFLPAFPGFALYLGWYGN